MSEPYIGEIQVFAFAYGKMGFGHRWMPCDGRLVFIKEYQALFSLIGTMYGGDGREKFALPNLNNSTVMGKGEGVVGKGAEPKLTPRIMGEKVGEPAVSLTVETMTIHTHRLQLGKSSAATQPGPDVDLVLCNPSNNGFVTGPPDTNMTLTSVVPTGNGVPHTNMQPYLPMCYCITTKGIYPTFEGF